MNVVSLSFQSFSIIVTIIIFSLICCDCSNETDINPYDKATEFLENSKCPFPNNDEIFSIEFTLLTNDDICLDLYPYTDDTISFEFIEQIDNNENCIYKTQIIESTCTFISTETCDENMVNMNVEATYDFIEKDYFTGSLVMNSIFECIWFLEGFK
jgi:hypothetical protein